MAVQLVLLLLFHFLHNAVSQTVLESDVPTDPICPNAPVVFTCTVEDAIALRWLVNNPDEVLLIQYSGETPMVTTTVPGIEPELTSAVPGSGAGLFNYESTLTVSNSSVVENDTIRCDGGSVATEIRQTVELRSPPVAPQFTCTLPGEGILRLNWNDTGDDVTEYRECVCDGSACSCVPSMVCGSTSVCERNLAAGQEQTYSFTAVNCVDQESSVSTLTTAGADAPTAPVFSEVRVRYDQSTGGLMNIMATWNRITLSDVVMGCNDLIGIQYTITCGGSSLVDLNMNCDSSTCWYMDNGPPSSGCTLSVAVRNAVGMATSTSTILDTSPLTVEVSNGTITCMGFPSCSIMYGTDPSNRNLIAVSEQAIPGLLPDETYFYLVTQTVNSQVVEVEGSFTLACLCSDLIDQQLDPLPTCSDSINGGTITGAISNGEVSYTSLTVNSGRATYECDEGFDISDENTRECQGDGSWSGTPPTCREEGSASIIGAVVGGVVGGIAALVLAVVVVMLVYLFCCRDKSKGLKKKRSDQQELRERTTSADAQPDGETAPTYADPNAIERQEFPGTHDVYTVVDTKKKTPKPEDQLPTYQAPESIKREAAPTTGELYTVPENKKGSKKKKETTPPEYSQVDLQKKHQPPSGLLYSQLDLPPSGKTPAPRSVEYTDIKPHS